MHLQHPRSIDSVRIYAPSPAKRYGLIALAAVAYAASLTACYRTAGVPYAKALEEGKALDDKDHARLAQKAAQHSAKLQRQKAQKLVEQLVDQQVDDAENKTKANSERKKAEEALARAAKLAEHTMASIKRGENKTDEELAIEVFGEDYARGGAPKSPNAAAPSPTRRARRYRSRRRRTTARCRRSACRRRPRACSYSWC